MTEQATTPIAPAPDLAQQLASYRAKAASGCLLIKALPDEQFDSFLTEVIKPAFPDLPITILTWQPDYAAKVTDYEVLHPGLGKRGLARALGRGFALCLIATGPRGLRGTRRFVADLAAVRARSKEKICCSPAKILWRQGSIKIFFAPVLTGLKLLGGLPAAILCAVVVSLLYLLMLVLGDILSRIVFPSPGAPGAKGLAAVPTDDNKKEG